MTKGPNLQEDVTILVYVHLTVECHQLTEGQTERDDSTITAGDFDTPLSEMDKCSQQTVGKDTAELLNTNNQLNIDY